MKKTAEFIIDDAVGHKMSTRPEYYSGRGPNPGDLSGAMLESFYDSIKKHNGDGAAEAFVAMVASLDTCGATPFLRALYTLARNGWTQPEIAASDKREWDLGKNPRVGSDETQAAFIGTLGSFLGRTKDDTARNDYAVRGAFLRSHGYVPGSKGENGPLVEVDHFGNPIPSTTGPWRKRKTKS